MAGGPAIARPMALTLDDLFASPDHYLHSFEGDAAVFMPMDRDSYHRSIFLDGRISPAVNRTMKVPAGALLPGVPPPAATSWIFHVAHCGSTLLARALDRPDGNLVLREPLALRQLALSHNAEVLALVMAMLSKRYRADAPTLIKANVPVNFVLPDIIAFDPQARAILLYCGLRDYLLAILRSDNHRTWLRNVTAQLAAYLGDLSDFSDAQRAAALWLAQMRAYAAAIGAMPNARGLDAERFFAEPRGILSAAAAHLRIPITEAETDEVVQGPLFSTYSKNPEVAFDNAARLARREALEHSIAPELDQAQAWIASRDDDAAPALAIVEGAALTAE
jgi:hypothetical protein